MVPLKLWQVSILVVHALWAFLSSVALRGPLNHPWVEIYVQRSSCAWVYSEHETMRIFRKGAVIATSRWKCAVMVLAHVWWLKCDPRSFFLSFAMPCSSVYNSSLQCALPRHAWRESRELLHICCWHIGSCWCWRDGMRVLSSQPMLRKTERCTEGHGIVFLPCGAPVTCSYATFSSVVATAYWSWRTLLLEMRKKNKKNWQIPCTVGIDNMQSMNEKDW